MSVDVAAADGETLAEWDDHVRQSPYATVFHRRAAVAAIADHASADPHYLVGHKGQEPVGVFPVFTLQRGPLVFVFSPPPNLRIPYLGPAPLNTGKLKQRKAERRQRRFVEGCLDWLAERFDPAYTHVRVTPTYQDLRPLTWAGFDASPAHTYVVDLTSDRADLLASFSSDARRNIRDADGREDVAVAQNGTLAIRSIHEQVRRRYRSQDIEFGLPVQLVLDLYEALPEGTIRPYACTVDGEFVGGILTYEQNGTVARWQGGVRTGTDLDVAVNDVLDWGVMTDALDRGCSAYDLVGADNPRINGYKAKFNPDLRTFYSLERGSKTVTAAAHAYKRLRNTEFFAPK